MLRVAGHCRTAPSEAQRSSGIQYEVIIVLFVSVSLLTLKQRYRYISGHCHYFPVLSARYFPSDRATIAIRQEIEYIAQR
jgi:hypothetical protein